MLKDITTRLEKTRNQRFLSNLMLLSLFIGMTNCVGPIDKKNGFLEGEVVGAELRLEKIYDRCDYDHISLVLSIFNTGEDSVVVFPRSSGRDGHCFPDSLPGPIKWVLSDTTFYLKEEKRYTAIAGGTRKRFVLRGSFEAKGDYLMRMKDNYSHYLDSDFAIEVRTGGHHLRFPKSDGFEIDYFNGSQKVDKGDSILLNFQNFPPIIDMEESKRIIDSLVRATPEVGEPAVDLDSI